MKVVYYAHPMSLYGKDQESRDIETLENLGFTIFNPNNLTTQMECLQYKDKGDSHLIMMEIFQPLVERCDALVFRAFPDGTIPAGVMQEIRFAQANDMPVFELPSSLLRRELTLAQTRETLAEIGQR